MWLDGKDQETRLVCDGLVVGVKGKSEALE
jgi:hypothetical protein